MLSLHSTQRFSSRVENYIKYRPTYPAAILDLLKSKCGLTQNSIVADVGSGTGILTELFLHNSNRVIGVEPNPDMRKAAENLLSHYASFTSVSGTAEATTLKDQSVDFVIVGQAFHWFDREKTHKEFLRILKCGGWLVLIWNERDMTGSFAQAYEQLLKTYGTDYEAVQQRHTDAQVIRPFLEINGYETATFSNQQTFDFEGLKGRLLSSSYAPEAGHPQHIPMLNALSDLFKKYQTNGQITFDYQTVAYYGQLS